MLQHDSGQAPTATTHTDDVIWAGPRPYPITRRRDRRTPTVPQVIAVERVTDVLRAATPHLPAAALYVAVIRANGTLVDVLAIPALDLKGLPALREYAQKAAEVRGVAYYETGVLCQYCNRLCPPEVAFDHARWLRANEARRAS